MCNLASSVEMAEIPVRVLPEMLQSFMAARPFSTLDARVTANRDRRRDDCRHRRSYPIAIDVPSSSPRVTISKPRPRSMSRRSWEFFSRGASRHFCHSQSRPPPLPPPPTPSHISTHRENLTSMSNDNRTRRVCPPLGCDVRRRALPFPFLSLPLPPERRRGGRGGGKWHIGADAHAADGGSSLPPAVAVAIDRIKRIGGRGRDAGSFPLLVPPFDPRRRRLSS